MKKEKFLVVLLLLLASAMSFSQNQTISNELILNDNAIAEEIIFDSNDSDEGLIALKNVFRKQKITTEISNIKRDYKNKILAIDVVMQASDGRISKLNVNKIKPIKAIKIYMDKRNNPNWDFGVEELYE